jgi:hypothetical protein
VNTPEFWRPRVGDAAAWVVFANGTCVVLDAPADDPVVAAVGALTGWLVDAEMGDDRIEVRPAEGGALVTTVPPRLRAFVSGGAEAARARAIFAADASAPRPVHVEAGDAPPPGNVG